MKAMILAVVVMLMGTTAHAQELKGSPESIGHQYLYAQSLSLAFIQTAEDIAPLVQAGVFVELLGNEDYELCDDGELCRVSHPYVLPETKWIVEDFARLYHLDCGEKLVVTSATRPVDEQPSNASPLSVHSTGMSVDFRLPKNLVCRRFLEETALYLEGSGVLDITKETNPHHYHLAIFIATVKKARLVATN